MARNTAVIRAPVRDVFAVLADPASYACWVVGSDTIRAADPAWPAPGARLHHRVRIGPLKIDDNTEVLDVSEPRRLVLQARFRPLGTARIILELAEVGDATQVTMTEIPGDRLSRLLHNPITDYVLRRRNDVALRRLADLATRGRARRAAPTS
jgi:uncharacterized protein YndB with AHSA1/START domain